MINKYLNKISSFNFMTRIKNQDNTNTLKDLRRSDLINFYNINASSSNAWYKDAIGGSSNDL